MKTQTKRWNELPPTHKTPTLKKRNPWLVLILCVSLAHAWNTAQGATLYVDVSAAAQGDGTSWASAFIDLQSALDAAAFGDEIWVADGTYTPSQSIDGSSEPRTAAFILKSGVKIYGGFTGIENQLHQRQLDPSSTILSGDVGTSGDDSDNSYHVVYADGVTDAVLDGFTITGGRAIVESNRFARDSSGGGMYAKNSALTVSRCIFSDNKVLYQGGAMYNKDSALTVFDCVFSGNQAGRRDSGYFCKGGGMYNEGFYTGLKSSVVRGCTFSDNVAFADSNETYQYGGGGMCNFQSAPLVDGCTFENNVAKGPSGVGGGMLNWGAYQPQPTIVNCVFKGNRGSHGGGGMGIIGSADILNCTFYDNGRGPSSMGYIRSYNGGAIFGYRWSARIVGVIFSGNEVQALGAAIYSAVVYSPRAVTITRCLFHENLTFFNEQCEGNDHIRSSNYAPDVTESFFDVDPLLADPENGDFHLLEGSPAIDAGVTRKYAKGTFLPLPDTDFEGNRRTIGGVADIGADEYVPNLTDLGAFLRALPGSGEIAQNTADGLLAYIVLAQTALDQDQDQTAKSVLKMLVSAVRVSLGATETAQLIEAKILAVIEEI